MKKKYEVRARDIETLETIDEGEKLPQYRFRSSADRYCRLLTKIRVKNGWTTWEFYVHDLSADA